MVEDGCGRSRGERVAVVFELVLQPSPDPALHTATEGPDQRPKQPEPPLRSHPPAPAHDSFVTLGGEGQPPGGLHRRACGERTQPVRPFELDELNDDLHVRPPHVCKEPCAQPDGQRCEQLDVSHGGVERGLVARIGDSVEDLLQRRCYADVSGDVSHAFMLSVGSWLTWPSLQSATGASAKAPMSAAATGVRSGPWTDRSTDTGLGSHAPGRGYRL